MKSIFKLMTFTLLINCVFLFNLEAQLLNNAYNNNLQNNGQNIGGMQNYNGLGINNNNFNGMNMGRLGGNNMFNSKLEYY